MKHAKVSEFKAKLSAYLAAVKRGDSIIVCDRITPIARLVPMETDANELIIEEPSLPARGLRKLKAVRLQRQVNVGRLLREDRDQR